ncbi:hypothetical protein [Elioraea rosea]|uniref:hypothetical protein n=1 Tax=Elioraea rosea TaxID=2492390 RepID=UPI001183EBEB|nr:hypothetical protein [Elioraea rosea]
MNRAASGFLAIALVGAFAGPAAATLRIPDCDALASWASSYERGAQWKPNQFGTRYWFPPGFAAPATADTFGKPVLEWSVEEAKEAAEALRRCEQALRRANRLAERNDVSAMRGYAQNNVARYLQALAEARAEVPARLSSLESAAPSTSLLAFYAALADLGRDRRAFNEANRATGGLQGQEQAEARALMAALRDLPEAEAAGAVREIASARLGTIRGGVRDSIVASFAEMPTSVASLQRLTAMPLALRREHGEALGAEDYAAIDRAIAARRAEMGASIADDLAASIAALPANEEAFRLIDQRTDERLLVMLPRAGAAKVTEAAAAQRQKAGAALLADLRPKLSALPETQESLDLIDGTLMPAIARIPDSAGEQKAKLIEADRERRAAILAAVNRAERGSLRGRVYDSPAGFSLEFVDRTRVFLKQGNGQTAAGTYTEEDDGRVVVSINGQSMVLTREGRTLAGGPTVFRRSK